MSELRIAREGKGWTLREAAKYAGVSESYASDLERGQRHASEAPGSLRYHELLGVLPPHQAKLAERDATIERLTAQVAVLREALELRGGLRQHLIGVWVHRKSEPDRAGIIVKSVNDTQVWVSFGYEPEEMLVSETEPHITALADPNPEAEQGLVCV